MRLFLCLLFCALGLTTRAADDSWQTALQQMPLNSPDRQLTRTNCVQIMLDSFQSNNVVKALVFMPGATDEFYMFRRAKAVLTNASPTLLDAVIALTNQTYIRATFHAPLLLFHTAEDPLDPIIVINSAHTAERIQRDTFPPHVVFNDKDWDYLLPILKKNLHVSFTPHLHSRDSWHFYRHSFAGWNLNGWEALQAIAYAGKTKFTIEYRHVAFEGDARVMAQPNLDHYLSN